MSASAAERTENAALVAAARAAGRLPAHAVSVWLGSLDAKSGEELVEARQDLAARKALFVPPAAGPVAASAPAPRLSAAVGAPAPVAAGIGPSTDDYWFAGTLTGPPSDEDLAVSAAVHAAVPQDQYEASLRAYDAARVAAGMAANSGVDATVQSGGGE